MKRILAIALLATAARAEYTCELTFPNAPATALENFPVLVRFSPGSLDGFSFADCPGATNLWFTDSNGDALPFEADTWNDNGTNLVWVSVPSLSASTTITMRWNASGAPTGLPASSAVWSRAGYVAVWHMNEILVDASTGTHYTPDSSANGWHAYKSVDGDAVPAPVTTAPGVSSHPTPLTGTAMNIAYGAGKTSSDPGGFLVPSSRTSTTTLNGPGFTLSAIVNSQQIANDGRCRIIAFGNDYNDMANLAIGYDYIYCMASQNHKKENQQGATGWVCAAAVYNSPRSKIYADGDCLSASNEGNPNLASLKLTKGIGLGCFTDGKQCLNGYLDEARIRNAASTAEWLKAEYDSVIDPESFVSFDVVVSPDTDLPQFGAVSATGGAGTAAFSVELVAPGYAGAVPTAVSVFYGTDGEHWTELSLGSTNEAATLTGTATGLPGNTAYLWYAAATATDGVTPKSASTRQRTFRTGVLPTTVAHKAFTATVSYAGTAAENVPVLLRLSETAIDGFDYDDVTASGFEIVDASGNLLPWEIDTWNTNGESLLWVRLPVWEDGATLTVRYGVAFANTPFPASATWADYVGVWHLNDTNGASAYGSYPNSTAAAGIDGEKALASAADEEGRFGKSVLICDAGTGTGAYQKGGVFVPDSGAHSPVDLGSTFVISGWFKHKVQNYYWNKLFGKRKVANNSAEPTGAFAIEIGNNGTTDNVNALGGGNSTYIGKQSLRSTLRGVWSYMTFVYNGSNLSIYQDGVLCKSGSINPATDNNAPLCFGNLTGGYGDGTGDAAWCGWIDEVRLADATPSAAWIAAEYAAMADPAALSYGRTVTIDSATPELSVPTVARNADGSFAVSVVVSGNVPASVACRVGGASVPMSTADAALPMTYSAVLSDLPDGTHVASVRAESTTGNEAFSDCPTVFHAGALSVTKLSDADEGSLTPGVFRISRLDADATGLPALTFDVALSGNGLAAVVAPGITTATIPAGAAYVDIALTPVVTDAVDEDADIVLTVSGTNIGMPTTGTLTVVNADFDVTVRYVATTGDDANHGGTPELPKKTIAAAVNSLRTVAQTQTCTVHVAPGLYPISTPLVVTNAISVIGDDPDPARTAVSNTHIGGWGAKNPIFTINHAGAFVANLTMQNGNVNGSDSGGNFRIGSAGGTVSNCVVEAGKCNGNNYAAGGYLSGGLVTHTIFRKNNCGSGMGNWQGQHGGVLELFGSSRAENCLLVDNPPSGTVYLSLIGDSAVMRNCTIANTGLSKTNEYCKVFTALRINSANATVLNTVIAGVTNKIDGAACPPTGTVANFVNGAFDGDATGLPAGTVTGKAIEFFPHYAENVPYALKYRPKAGGPLYDKGANYDGMALYDLSGTQKRKVGSHVDIGCYEANGAGTMLLIK